MAERPVVVKADGRRPRAGTAIGGALGWRAVQDERDSGGAGGSARAMREERLARALRDNLRRRKAQARAGGHYRTQDDAAPADGSTSPEGGEA